VLEARLGSTDLSDQVSLISLSKSNPRPVNPDGVGRKVSHLSGLIHSRLILTTDSRASAVWQPCAIHPQHFTFYLPLVRSPVEGASIPRRDDVNEILVRPSGLAACST
jgi:hypothetical protein